MREKSLRQARAVMDPLPRPTQCPRAWNWKWRRTDGPRLQQGAWGLAPPALPGARGGGFPQGAPDPRAKSSWKGRAWRRGGEGARPACPGGAASSTGSIAPVQGRCDRGGNTPLPSPALLPSPHALGSMPTSCQPWGPKLNRSGPLGTNWRNPGLGGQAEGLSGETPSKIPPTPGRRARAGRGRGREPGSDCEASGLWLPRRWTGQRDGHSGLSVPWAGPQPGIPGAPEDGDFR